MDSAYVQDFPLAYQKAIAITPKVTGFLSMLGSSWILFEVLSDKRKRQSMYHRILLFLSISELNCSFWTYFLSSWMLPSGDEQGYSFFGASGNWATCNVQGFMFQVDIATPLYNAALSLYYLLLLRYNWTPKQMAQRIEPYLHAFILTFSFATAMAPLFLTLYNPTFHSWCSMTEYPYNCQSPSELSAAGADTLPPLDTVIEDPVVTQINNTALFPPEQPMHQYEDASNSTSTATDNTCIRGRSQQFAALFSWLLEFLPIWLVIVFTTVSMALVYYTVRHQERKMERRYRFHGLALKRSRQQQRGQQQQEEQQQLQFHRGTPNNNGNVAASLNATPLAVSDNAAVPSRPSLLILKHGLSKLSPRRKRQSQLKRQQQQQRKQRESERILTICILYTSSFYATFGCYTMLNAVMSIKAFEQASPTLIFAMVMLSNICLPLEGFFVCLIYLYPRYRRYKEQRAKQRMEEYNNRQQEMLDEKQRHPPLAVADNASELRSNVPVGGVAEVNNTSNQQEGFTNDYEHANVDGVLSFNDDDTLNRTNQDRVRRQQQQPQVLRPATSGVSSIAHSAGEQPHNDVGLSDPRRRSSWYAKVPVLSLVDWKSLAATFRRGLMGWKNDEDDDDYRLGCEVLSILSILSTDANGNLPPSPQQRLSEHRRSNNLNDDPDEGDMVGAVIQFDNSRGASDQFRNLSIMRDSLRTTTNINLLEELDPEDAAALDEETEGHLGEGSSSSSSSSDNEDEEDGDGASTTMAVHS